VVQARLAFGGVAATPVRALAAEAALVGQPLQESAIAPVLAALAAELHPISDHRGSATYRARLVQNLLRGFVAEAAAGPPPVPDRATGTTHLGGAA